MYDGRDVEGSGLCQDWKCNMACVNNGIAVLYTIVEEKIVRWIEGRGRDLASVREEEK